MPSYGLMDLHAGYGFPLKTMGEKGRTPYLNFRVSVLNLLNEIYIADAQNNDRFTQSFNNFDAQSASVFYGLGRRFNVSVQLQF